MMIWEYKIETLSFASEDLGLKGAAAVSMNEWGSEGWELVAFHPNAWGKNQTWPALIFKRPKKTNA